MIMADSTTPADELPRMSIDEFAADGYLQETNRRLLHPLGLSLELVVDGEGRASLEVVDARDDVEGCYIEPAPANGPAVAIESALLARRHPRQTALGYFIQPPTGL